MKWQVADVMVHQYPLIITDGYNVILIKYMTVLLKGSKGMSIT
jgi:hypothetical protein